MKTKPTVALGSLCAAVASAGALALPAASQAASPGDLCRANSIFSIGNTVDPADAYRAFRGRDPNVDALMIKRGFPVTSKSADKK